MKLRSIPTLPCWTRAHAPARGRARTAAILGSLATLLAAPAAQAITYATIDGHPSPVNLTLGETVTIRLDVAKAGDAVQFRIARDLNRSGKYDPTAPTVGGGSFTDGSGQDTDPEPGKIAAPYLFRPDWAAGPYVLHFEDTGNRTSFDLPGVTLEPKPEPQAISGRVLVVSQANPAGTPPPDAIVWAYDTAQKPVANANIRQDGSYTLPVPPGTYVLFAEWFGNLRSLRQVVNLVSGQQRSNVDVVLLQGQEVAGTVRSGGQPVADAIVQAVTASGTTVATRTLPDGTYVLVLPSGSHRVSSQGMIEQVTVADGPVDGVDFPPAAPASTPATGSIVTVAGNGIFGYGGDGRPATTARLSAFGGIASDPAGNLYIAFNAINRIRKIDAKTGIITSIAGSSAFESVRGLQPALGSGGYGGDGGPATQALLNTPQNVALDAAGNLYIGDTVGHRVRKVDPNGIITTVAGTGQEGFSGDGGPATQAQLAAVQGVAVDKSGNLYIADQRNRRVRKVDSKTGVITTIVGGGTEPVKDGAGATAIALGGRPFGLALDLGGNLFIGDGGLNRILKVSPAGLVSIVAGTGTPGFSGDGGPATQAQFNNSSPRLAVDSAGNLYFADGANNRIRKVSADGIITTVAGSGPIFPDPGSFAGDGGPATAARLWDCTGVAIDGAGNLYITDRGNLRIRKVIGIAAPGVSGGQ
jgi:sugar lactone lactonase YvrE